jgi:hypothetical protein
MSGTTTWYPTTPADYDQLKGKAVVSATGENVGSIRQIFHPDQDMPAARGRHFFLLEPGMRKDWFGGVDQVYLPESAVEGVSADQVTLKLSAKQIKQHGKAWTTRPSGFASYRRG